MATNQRRTGIVLSYVSMLLNIVVGLIYVPLLIHFLGKDEYGLYQLMGSVIAYMSVMDFGLAGTITRYYSGYLALDDKHNQSNVLAISGIIYCIISIITLIIGVLIYINLDTIFSKSLTLDELNKAKQIFIIMLINIAITIPSHIFTAIINSHERFVFIRLLSIIQTVLQPFVVIAVIYYKADVIGLVIVQTLFNMSTIAVKAYYSLKKMNVEIKLYSWDKELVKDMLTFSFFIFLNMIIDQIYWKTDQIVLGIISGTSAVAIYSIASQLNSYYMNFSTSINSVFLPQISAISVKTDDMTQINSIFNGVGRMQFAIMSLILTGFILYGKSFIVFWVGKDFERAYYMSLIIMIPLLIPLIENTGIIILQAKNKHAFRSKVYAFIAILNIALTIPLAKLYGGIGCAIATSFALIVGNVVIINIYYHREIGIDIIAFTKEILAMFIPVIISLAMGFIINHYIATTSVPMLIIKIIIYILIFFTLMWFMGFNEDEKNIFRGMLKRTKAIRIRGKDL